MAMIKTLPAGVSFAVKVHPRAKKNAITGQVDEVFKLALTAPPGGRHQPLHQFLAKLLNVHSSVTIAASRLTE
jgi:uncharacterized protein YggU (UPF0235/DUF167 family)